jgi:dipeptidyl aminopeptidase/acylaminoacyl peptidase
LLSVAGVLFLAGTGVGLPGPSSVRSAREAALLVVEYPGYQPSSTSKVTIISLAGKQLAVVPTRLRNSPFGLSPDARMVAAVSGNEPGATRREFSRGGVLVGPVRGGSMRTLLRGNCDSPPCPYGPDPSYAWSPDSKRLAAAAIAGPGRTLLHVFDRAGHVLRSLALPRTNASLVAGHVYYHVVSWSPDGSRLLLRQYTEWAPEAVVVVDIASARVRTLEQLSGPGGLTALTWSPDGRYVALAYDGTHDANDLFAVVDARSARTAIRRSVPNGDPARMSDPVWSPDGRSLYVSARGGIDRVYLSGRRSSRVLSDGIPKVALRGGLVYSTRTLRALRLYDPASGHRRQLIASRTGIDAVVRLSRLP